MAYLVRTPILALAFFLSAVPFMAQSAEAKSTFMAECSAKYKAAKADGSIDDTTKWTDFMKEQCKDLQTDAEAAPAPEEKITKAKTTAKKAEAPAEAIAATPSGSFIKDCSAAWKSMKANNTVPEGLTWKAFVTGKCVATPATAPVEAAAPDATFMEKCATDWKAMKAAYTVPEGLTWKTFVKGKCVDKPAVTKVVATKKKADKKVTAVEPEASTETFLQKCSTDWKAMKAANTVPKGLTWVSFVIGKCVAKPAETETAATSDYKSFIKKCGDDWKAMKAGNTVPEGLTWRQFVTAKCIVDGTTEPTKVVAKKAKKKATDADVAPTEPTAADETKPVKLVDKNGKAFTSGQLAAHARARTCGAKWRAEKASGTLEDGAKWPQYWSTCNTELKTASQ